MPGFAYATQLLVFVQVDIIPWLSLVSYIDFCCFCSETVQIPWLSSFSIQSSFFVPAMAMRSLLSRKTLTSVLLSGPKLMGLGLTAAQSPRGLQTFTLPDLSYDYGALEPAISGEIMQLHHQKHHQTYITNYNKALEQLHDAMEKGDSSTVVKLQSAIKFNGGGSMLYSFSLFFLPMGLLWSEMDNSTLHWLAIKFVLTKLCFIESNAAMRSEVMYGLIRIGSAYFRWSYKLIVVTFITITTISIGTTISYCLDILLWCGQDNGGLYHWAYFSFLWKLMHWAFIWILILINW